MRITLLGAGTVGGIVAASLASRGNDLTVVCRDAHATAIGQHGYRIDEPDGRTWSTPPVAAHSDVASAADPDVDVVIFASKTFDTESILAQWVEAGGSTARAVSLQNTVANERLLDAHFDEVAGAVVRIGGDIEGPGHIRARIPRRLLIGPYANEPLSWLGHLEGILVTSGIGVELTEDVMREKWFKLVLNCDSALSAICDLGVNELATAPAVAVRQQLREEAQQALAAEGIDLPALPPIEVQGPPASPGGYSSTWYDLNLQRGRVETRWLNGEILRIANQHHMSAPANQTLLRICEEMAAAKQRPGAYSLEDVSKQIEAA